MQTLLRLNDRMGEIKLGLEKQDWTSLFPVISFNI
ncbi:hypothetical protein PAN31108_04945 [Pandoraea anhela]|uniref:Uncharacterized protein n=1 Tax=Pandoraea anhela TaxID=2508295 RepID=A0A5E4Z215_9BURK|nr:hypothetical protein PAN31108_04945 [Pandoraea anhela]